MLHGIDRLTADIDLAVDLAPDVAERFVKLLLSTGYRPAAPVDALQFAVPAMREAWHRDRNMQVFSFWDSSGRRPTIDVFLEPPVPFEDLMSDSVRVQIAPDLAVRVASVAHLIRLKEIAGRPQDLADIERLRELQGP